MDSENLKNKGKKEGRKKEGRGKAQLINTL